MTFQSDSNLKRMRSLEKELSVLRDQLIYVPPTNDLSLSFGNLGSRNAAHGVLTGSETIQPLFHLITDVDSAGTSTGIFDKINLMSSNIIVDRTGFTALELKYIQRTSNDGQRIGALSVATGKTLTLKTGGNLAITSDVSLDENSLVYLIYSEDIGNKYRVLVSTVGSGGATVPVGTTENDHLEWNNTLLQWERAQILQFGVGAGLHAETGFINFLNDTVGLAWRNAADTDDLQIKVNTSNQFEFLIGAVSKLNIGSDVELGADLDAAAFNILSTVDPATNIFRIIFDGHDDSDTFLSNSTTADRINVFSNGVNILAFRTTDVLMGVKLDMNTQDITSIGNMDFGTGSPTSGRIRIPNTASIKWESVSPTENYGELLFDVDEKFFWAVPAGGAFGFWGNGFQLAEINESGLDMMLNQIFNTGSILSGVTDTYTIGTALKRWLSGFIKTVIAHEISVTKNISFEDDGNGPPSGTQPQIKRSGNKLYAISCGRLINFCDITPQGDITPSNLFIEVLDNIVYQSEPSNLSIEVTAS